MKIAKKPCGLGLRPLLLGLLPLALVACQSPGGAPGSKDAKPGQKLCALTFDDGPDPEKTVLVLDKLKQHGVVATFFVVGQRLDESTAPIVKRMVNQGCELGNHSWSYSALDSMDESKITTLIDKTQAAIKRYSGRQAKFFRPPNLATSDTMYKAINLVFAEGVLGMDWAGCDTDAATRAQNVLSGVRDGAIILLHDVQPDPHPTPEALDILIPELKARGYRMVTLSELFKLKGVAIKPQAGRMWKYVQ